mmetsp:Transcript_115873/g.327891  ORF Transcript_115873/g.327891 Transcript_115873/m.327891 type:complete len:373 (-) Transcript_115873:204-1322(-)
MSGSHHRDIPSLPDLQEIFVRPIGCAPTSRAAAALQVWIEHQRAVRNDVEIGQTFCVGGQDYAVTGATPRCGTLALETRLHVSSEVVPPLLRVQWACLDGETAMEDSQLYDLWLRPYLQRQLQRTSREGRFFMTVTIKSVLEINGCRFGVEAMDPEAFCGALDRTTTIHVRREETPLLESISVLPYGDTLPTAYGYDSFRDYVKPFFESHPFSMFQPRDQFMYHGVRFKVRSVEPPGVRGRVGYQTSVYCDGRPLQPLFRDFLPPDMQLQLSILPSILQTIMAHFIWQARSFFESAGVEPVDPKSCQVVRWSQELVERGSWSTCMVCLATFGDGEELRRLSCGANHLFHVSCIDEWLKRASSCPICKQPAAT